MADSVSATLSRSNARLPVSTSYKMQPSEKKSRRRRQRLSAHLLRRHVADRPDGCAGTGQCGLRQLVIIQGEAACQTEVENLQDPLGGDEQIVRLEIAVDNSLPSRRHAGGYLHSVCHGLL